MQSTAEINCYVLSINVTILMVTHVITVTITPTGVARGIDPITHMICQDQSQTLVLLRTLANKTRTPTERINTAGVMSIIGAVVGEMVDVVMGIKVDIRYTSGFGTLEVGIVIQIVTILFLDLHV